MTTRTFDPTQPAFTQALDALRPELEAIPRDQLLPIRHDILDAVVVALGVAGNVARFRPQVASQIGEPAARQLDRLDTTARAAGRAHALHLTTLHGIDVEQMVEELGQQRRVLLAEVRALVSKHQLSPAVLGEMVGGTGRKALCLDVLQLTSAMRAEWATIATLTAVTSGELDHAEAMANALATTLGENEVARSTVSPTAELRQRAYTLFVKTYDEVRRAITFVCWDSEDADEIAPSLSAGRKRHVEEEDAPVTNGAAPTTPGAPGGSPFTVPS